MVENKTTLLERLRNRLERKDEGLALLDVLIGMAIFALIAIIAVSALSQFRQRAFENSAQSDVKSLATAIEGAFTDTQSYPADTAFGVGGQTQVDAALAGAGVKLTKNVTVAAYKNNTTSFCIAVVHKSNGTQDAWAKYTDGVTTSGRTATAPTCP